MNDVMICVAQEKQLRENFKEWEEQLIKRKMIINNSKTKIMLVGNKDERRKLEQMNLFRYLIVNVHNGGEIMEMK